MFRLTHSNFLIALPLLYFEMRRKEPAKGATWLRGTSKSHTDVHFVRSLHSSASRANATRNPSRNLGCSTARASDTARAKLQPVSSGGSQSEVTDPPFAFLQNET